MKNTLIFIAIVILAAAFYWGFLDNYFFSDDFEWLSRGVIAQNSTSEIFKIVGRDFNPVFLGLLTLSIRAGGLSPLLLRLLSLLTFSAVIFMFFHLLSHYFKIHELIALSAAMLAGLNAFTSEVVLNMAALVYSLSILLFLAAIKFYLDGKRKHFLFVIFAALALLTKETILLGAIPLFFWETDKKNRLFLGVSAGALVLIRVLLQTGASGSYTSFLHVSNFFYKLYFIIMRTMNISPYALNPAVGAGMAALILSAALFFTVKLRKTEAGGVFLFFLLWLTVFSLFFSLLPKLSSRYIFFPVFGFWGLAAQTAQYFLHSTGKKKITYALIPLLLVFMVFNYILIRGEVGDYKILGDFSKQFISEQGAIIKKAAENPTPIEGTETQGIKIPRPDYSRLAGIYKTIRERGNLPKLLPFRSGSLGGVIKPEHLVPLVFYPGKIVRWRQVQETPKYFTGYLLIN